MTFSRHDASLGCSEVTMPQSGRNGLGDFLQPACGLPAETGRSWPSGWRPEDVTKYVPHWFKRARPR
jgi:hypothetical protein